MSFLCHFSFSLYQYRVNLMRSATRMPGRAVPALPQLPIQPLTKRVDFAGGGSRGGNRQGMSCWRLSKEESAAPAPVSGETLPLWGAAPCDGESLIGGILRRSPTPARCAIRSWKLRPSAADADQRRPRRRSRHLHKTGTEPGHMAGPPAGRKRVSLSQLCDCRLLSLMVARVVLRRSAAAR